MIDPLFLIRFFPQTEQGADILSERLNAKVVMPDFAHGKPFDVERYNNPPSDANIYGEITAQFFDPKFMHERVSEVKEVATALKAEGKTFVGVRLFSLLLSS